MFAVDGSRKHPSTNALDNFCARQAEAIGFTSILTMDQDATSKRWKHLRKGKGKKRARVAAAGM